MCVTCEGSRGLLPALVVIPLSVASSPRSKLLLFPPGGGGGDGGGCRSPALSPAASGRRDAEAGASERRAPPRSRPAPGRPARLARSRLPPLRSRGIVFPRPPTPPPPGLEHATFSRLRPPRPPPPLLLCLPPLCLSRAHESRKKAGEPGGRRKAAQQRRGSSDTEDPGGQPESRAGALASDACAPTARSPAWGAARGARGRPRGSLRGLRRPGVGAEASPTLLPPRPNPARLM